MRANLARSAAFEHFLPVGAGALVGVVVAVVFPSETDSGELFGATAQILPVLLLALALEARVFGIHPRRQPPGDKIARRLEDTRALLGLATVVVLLVGELHALWALGNNSAEPRSAWIEYGVLAWGFTTVGLLAIIGLGRPRIEARLEWRQPPGPPNRVVVEVGASNEYGDKDVAPIMDFLIPDELSIDRCDGHGNVDRHSPVATRPLTWSYAGVQEWHYPAERLLVSAGDATIRNFSIGGLVPGKEYRVVLRFDHAELPNGRVETQDVLRTQDGSSKA